MTTKPIHAFLSLTEQEAFLKSSENVQRATVQHLGAHQTGEFTISFVANLQLGIDRVVQSAIDRGDTIACRAGCSHCCSARVEASAPEIFRIARAISSRPAAAIGEMIEHLQAHAQANAGKSHWKQRTSCPFLKDALCSVYEIRPAGCRKAHSLDVRACEAGSDEIPQSLEVVLAAEALVEGTLAGYRECGFATSRHELVSGVLFALSDPTTESRWLNGEAVFG